MLFINLLEITRLVIVLKLRAINLSSMYSDVKMQITIF